MLNFVNILPMPSHSPSRHDVSEESSTTVNKSYLTNKSARSLSFSEGPKCKVLKRRNATDGRKRKHLVDQKLRIKKLDFQKQCFRFGKEASLTSASFPKSPKRNGLKWNGKMKVEANISANLVESIPAMKSVRSSHYVFKNRKVTEGFRVPESVCRYSQMLHDLCMAHPYMIEMLQAEYPNIWDGSVVSHDNRQSSLRESKIQCTDLENAIGDSWDLLQPIPFASRGSWESSVSYSKEGDISKVESMFDMDFKNPAKDISNISSHIQDEDHANFDPILTSICFSAPTPESCWFSDLMLESDENLLVAVDSFASLKDY